MKKCSGAIILIFAIMQVTTILSATSCFALLRLCVMISLTMMSCSSQVAMRPKIYAVVQTTLTTVTAGYPKKYEPPPIQPWKASGMSTGQIAMYVCMFFFFVSQRERMCCLTNSSASRGLFLIISSLMVSTLNLLRYMYLYNLSSLASSRRAFSLLVTHM